ncbi:OmpA family protein [Rhizobium sp. TH2]|uniref:OmpA family protein n=1 Tax=Rhizobium sp. TH2 TaxID=2775403 RepID=UPI00215751AD|nr:OmpA family protein [Rhizobium sp. TH2]UVC10878.1 OmpA family protein [Rhizobium sp. TH2]
MAFKTRLLATAAIPFMALAGYSLPVSAAMIKPAAEIQTQSPFIAVQSEEEEVVPKKRRKQQEQQDGAQEQVTDPANAEAVEEPVRKNRKQRKQAEEQQTQEMQPADNAEAVEEPVRKNRKKQKQAEEQQTQEMQPADNAEAVEEPVRKNRKKQQQTEEQQADEAQPADNAEAVEEPVRKNRKKQKQAEEQQMDEAQPADNAEAVEEPVRKNRKKQQADQGVSDEDIVNQSKRKKQAQQDDQTEEQNAADTEEPVRKNRKKQQQADDAQQAEDGQQDAKPAGEVTDEDIVNMSKDRKKKRDRAQAETPEAIEKREEVAKDPSKTTDTVVLPVENGAAVLDSDKDADNSGANRERRKRQREQVEEVRVPKSDKDAQNTDVKIVIKNDIDVKGERIDDFRGYRRDDGKIIGKGDDVRVVFDLDGKIVIRSDDRRRLGRDGDIRYERLRDDRIKEIVIRPNGDRIVTIRNRWGEIIRRSRIDNRDVEIVIFYSPDLERGRDRLYLRDAGDELPPMRLGIPVEDYIVDVSSDPDRDYDEFLSEPPVEQVERVYSVDEVKNSARIRDKVRRIDLDTITFDTASAEISRDQAKSLRKVAEAIGAILDRNPGETFLIEGHTDAVGSDESNLVLSDERAESVASVLSELFEIPAENLVTQGYGERYLKIDTDEDERENRRVTIRRITPLVRPAEVSEN